MTKKKTRPDSDAGKTIKELVVEVQRLHSIEAFLKGESDIYTAK